MASRQIGETTSTSRGTADLRGVVTTGVGMLLVVLGAVLLVAVGIAALDVLRNPSEVAIVALLLEEMNGEGAAIFGSLGDTRFSIGIGEPLKTLLFAVVAVWLLGTIASILKTLVTIGRDLLAQGRAND